MPDGPVGELEIALEGGMVANGAKKAKHLLGERLREWPGSALLFKAA